VIIMAAQALTPAINGELQADGHRTQLPTQLPDMARLNADVVVRERPHDDDALQTHRELDGKNRG